MPRVYHYVRNHKEKINGRRLQPILDFLTTMDIAANLDLDRPILTDLRQYKKCDLLFSDLKFWPLYRAFFGAILWRLIEALASEGLSFLPIP